MLKKKKRIMLKVIFNIKDNLNSLSDPTIPISNNGNNTPAI